MLKSIQQRDLDRNRWIKITMAVILGLICVSMVVTLVPGLMTGSLTSGNSPDAIATVGGQDISLVEAQRQLSLQTQQQAIPPMLRAIYAKQIADGLIFRQVLQVEADRLGITVSPDEERARIKEILPSAFSGDSWLKDRYESEVQTRLNMTVADFEAALRDNMLEEKFREMVTDGVTVSDAEIQQEFRARNEKVQIQYALIKPSDLAATIHPTDADLTAYFTKNASKYQVPEKRAARYALLDLAKLKASVTVSDDELQAYYKAHIDEYKVDNRAHVERILFKTAGKTDAEIAEIKQKAEAVLKQGKSGANFEDLAKKNSEDDATKDKGGDLGWIVQGQTVPEFEKAAFSVPKGGVSDLVQTPYGFEIVKVLDRETAHTKTFQEVRDTILPEVQAETAEKTATDISNQMAAAVRQSDRQPLDALASKFHLETGETGPISFNDPVGDLGNTPDLHRALFELQPGELSQPLQLDQGVAILTTKQILPAHQGTLVEVHDQVLADYQRDQSTVLAQQRAGELAKRVQGGEAMDKAAKDLGVEVKTSESFNRSGSIPDVGTGKQLQAAFGKNVGQSSGPANISGNWLVYRVTAHTAPNPADLAAQHDDIQKTLLQTKQEAAFDAFRTSLEAQLTKEGKLVIHKDVMNRLTNTTS